MKNIKITWLGHSCFIIEADAYKILIDPYKNGYIRGLKLYPQQVNETLCSHEHTDHNAIEIAQILPQKENPFTVEIINTYHDNKKGALRGLNKIHIFKAFGLKAVHFGDIGCDISADEEKLLKNADVIMIPIGGTYTITAKDANNIAERISPRAIIPMHYRTNEFGFRELQHIGEFAALRNDAIYSDVNYAEITGEQKGCVILKYDCK